MRITVPLTAALMVAVAALAGCYEYRVKYDGWETVRAQLGDRPNTHNDPDRFPDRTDAAEGFAVLITTFEGASRYHSASAAMRRLVRSHRIGDAWMREVSGKVHVYRGRYPRQTDLDAQQSLTQVRAIEEDGLKPYADAQLVSLGQSATVARPQDDLDLQRHSGQGYYTLQVAFYDEAYGPDFRDAAEQYARDLRGRNQRAFYFHGPNRSMVTIELFTDADFEQAGAVRDYGPRILELQEKFPNNLGNGRTVIESYREGKKTEKRNQPSFLVRAP